MYMYSCHALLSLPAIPTLSLSLSLLPTRTVPVQVLLDSACSSKVTAPLTGGLTSGSCLTISIATRLGGDGSMSLTTGIAARVAPLVSTWGGMGGGGGRGREGEMSFEYMNKLQCTVLWMYMY